MESAEVVKQWAYPLSPPPSKAKLDDRDQLTGLPDLLSLGQDRFLSLERSWLPPEVIKAKIFRTDCSKATDISHRDGLVKNDFQPCRKKLLLDLDAVKKKLRAYNHIDNLEGMALGPKLDKGGRMLFVIADDNFSSQQNNQILLLKYTPGL